MALNGMVLITKSTQNCLQAIAVLWLWVAKLAFSPRLAQQLYVPQNT